MPYAHIPMPRLWPSRSLVYQVPGLGMAARAQTRSRSAAHQKVAPWRARAEAGQGAAPPGDQARLLLRRQTEKACTGGGAHREVSYAGKGRARGTHTQSKANAGPAARKTSQHNAPDRWPFHRAFEADQWRLGWVCRTVAALQSARLTALRAPPRCSATRLQLQLDSSRDHLIGSVAVTAVGCASNPHRASQQAC